jgi:hypothetical protein
MPPHPAVSAVFGCEDNPPPPILQPSESHPVLARRQNTMMNQATKKEELENNSKNPRQNQFSSAMKERDP